MLAQQVHASIEQRLRILGHFVQEGFGGMVESWKSTGKEALDHFFPGLVSRSGPEGPCHPRLRSNWEQSGVPAGFAVCG